MADIVSGQDVDILSHVPGTGATNLGKAEDATHNSGDTGVMALAVRQDTTSPLAGDGDYIPLSVNALGALRVAGTETDNFDGQYNRALVVAGVDDDSGALPINLRMTTGTGALIVHVTSGTVTATPAVASTATLSNVNDTASSTTLLSSNANRKGAMIFNDSTEILYVKFGTTASTTSFTVKMLGGSYYELPGPVVYTGRIDGIWAADGSGAARITEIT